MTKREQLSEAILICVVIMGLVYWFISLKLGDAPVFSVVDHWLVLFGAFIAGILAMLNRHRPVQAWILVGSLFLVVVMRAAWEHGYHSSWIHLSMGLALVVTLCFFLELFAGLYFLSDKPEEGAGHRL